MANQAEATTGSVPAALVYAPALAQAELRPDHPLKYYRARLCYDLLASTSVLDSNRVTVISPAPASEDDVRRVHTADYVEMVRRLSDPQTAATVDLLAQRRYGFDPAGDTPPFPGMYDYQLLVAGASIEAVRLVDEGHARFAFSPAGGVNHHAMPSQAAGFGIFNDAAIAIAWLRARGQRVMYLDLDVHHGNGVEAAFETDDSVLTVSLHESTRFLYPGTGGHPEDIGHGPGRGYAVNVALAPYTDDETWLWAFDQVVPPLYHAFGPDLLVVQLGADGYWNDPLAHLQLTTRAYEAAAQRLGALTGGRLAAVGGGGYDVQATARIWAIECCTLAGAAVPAELHDPADRAPRLEPRARDAVRRFAEQSVETIRQLVFPLHGLPAQ